MSARDTLVLGSGVAVSSLAPLLPRLQLPWDYAVLAAILSPANGERSAFVLLNTCREGDPQPYVVYRVDREDGSCHGGRYCGDYPRALQIFAETVCGIETAYCGSRETKAHDRGYAAAMAERPVNESSGLNVLRAYDRLPAPQQLRRECWVTRGAISGNLEEQSHLPLDTVEWQFGDAPSGSGRGYSEDFLTLEDGLREMSGAVINWDPDNDSVPEGYLVSTVYEDETPGWRGVVTCAATGEILDTTSLLHTVQSQALQSARDLAWELAPAPAA